MAILTVGTSLSSVIADGLYEQRRDRVLQESAEIRADLTQSMTQLSGATSTQQQDAANAFVQNVGGGQDGVDSRDAALVPVRSEEHTSELQSRGHLVCRLVLEKKKAF